MQCYRVWCFLFSPPTSKFVTDCIIPPLFDLQKCNIGKYAFWRQSTIFLFRNWCFFFVVKRGRNVVHYCYYYYHCQKNQFYRFVLITASFVKTQSEIHKLISSLRYVVQILISATLHVTFEGQKCVDFQNTQHEGRKITYWSVGNQKYNDFKNI